MRNGNSFSQLNLSWKICTARNKWKEMAYMQRLKFSIERWLTGKTFRIHMNTIYRQYSELQYIFKEKSEMEWNYTSWYWLLLEIAKTNSYMKFNQHTLAMKHFTDLPRCLLLYTIDEVTGLSIIPMAIVSNQSKKLMQETFPLSIILKKN